MFNCLDSITLSENHIWAFGGYGILNYSTTTLIDGKLNTEFPIKGAEYGIYCFSSSPSDSDYAHVRRTRFDYAGIHNAYSVYVHSGSTVDLGTPSSPGYNSFHVEYPSEGVCCDTTGEKQHTYNVWNASAYDVWADSNYWADKLCPGGGKGGGGNYNSCWPFNLEDTGLVVWNNVLPYDPFGGELGKVRPSDPEVASTPLPTSEAVSNYPNPFNSSTVIEYSIANTGKVDISIYNILGQHVRTMWSGEREPGIYQVTWDGRDDGGDLVASGVYLYRITTPTSQISKSMVLLK